MILGVSLNSRIIGLAVLKDTSLEMYKVHMFKECWTEDKQTQILDCICDYIGEYAIQSVALMLPLLHCLNPQITELIEQIRKYCEGQKLRFCSYSVEALETIRGQARAKKKALMEALSLRFPELSLAKKKELCNKNRYYYKLFEAVGVATLMEKEIAEK